MVSGLHGWHSRLFFLNLVLNILSKYVRHGSMTSTSVIYTFFGAKTGNLTEGIVGSGVDNKGSISVTKGLPPPPLYPTPFRTNSQYIYFYGLISLDTVPTALFLIR